jgi:hypothetical protein
MRTRIFFKAYCLNIIFLFPIIIAFSLTGCSSDEPEVEDNSNKFRICLLEDQSITWESLKGKSLDSLKLKEWITGDKIDFYDYSSHVIYLKTDYTTLLSFTHNNNTPFVVVANDKKIYAGCFGTPKDTTDPCVVFKPLDLCTDLVMLEFNPPQRKDIRFNEEIKSALKSAGKLKLGIGYEVKGVVIIKNAAKTPFIFSPVTCYNYEENYIYTQLFSCFTTKVGSKTYRTKLVLYNQSSYYSLPAVDTSNQNFDRVTLSAEDADLYTNFTPFYNNKFPAEWSAYNIPVNLPNGVYNFYIEYYGMMGCSKENRIIKNSTSSRMWMGYLRSATIQMEYDSLKGIIKNTTVTLN